MDAVLKAVVEAIHASPTQAVLCLSGGASQAVGWLLSVPRASSTVLEVTVPYSRISMLQLLGKTPSKFVSRETAEEIALVAYNRALHLSLPGVPVAGIGFSGALVSATPKRGDHRCHIAARTQTGLWHYNLTLSKGFRDRSGEDELTSRVLIKTLANVCGVPAVKLPLGLLEADEKLDESKEVFTEDVQLEQLISGTISMMKYPGSGDLKAEGRRVVLSGSFNPVHDGHLKLMDVACSLCEGGIPCFELAAVNADKPPLSHDEIKRRVKQFQDRGKTIIVTNEPLFYKKAEIFPDSTFVIGVDTAVRLITPKYYDGSKERMLEVLLRLKEIGCDFLVAGRKVAGQFQVLGDLEVPVELQTLFRPVSDELFREDISSTELRSRSGL
ncbi:unnamed protein product [Calypogeia fissa]